MQIIKVPGINGLGKTNGCENAGNAVLALLRNNYSNEQGKLIDVKILDLEEIHLDNGNLELTNKLIYENALEAFETKPKLMFLGGDHSISYSIGRAFLRYCAQANKNPCLIVFDSHPNCVPSAGSGFPTHEEWLRALIEQGFPSENILIVGLRNSYSEELQFIRERKIKTLGMNEILLDIENACDAIMEFADGKELYLSLDIDIVDPVFAPATGYKEPGGLTSRQLIYLIQRINKMKNLKAADIVEINAEKDKEYDHITLKLGTKVLSEFL